MTYEDFFTPEEVATYKRVKKGTMRLSRAARNIAATMVGGKISNVGPEFVNTSEGKFCLVMAENSLNSTERFAIGQQGAEIVVMGDPIQMRDFFLRHGRRGGNAQLRSSLQRAMRSMDGV